MRIVLSIVACLFAFTVNAQKFELKELNKGRSTGLRGLSVVDDKIAWVSGSNGQVGRSMDAGKSWEWVSPKGYEKLDFRDIEAFDENRAVIVNAGSPAYILLTDNGGTSWEQVYYNPDSLIFLDGMDFWGDKRGIIFGDPIHNKMPLLETQDGGRTWKSITNQMPFELQNGEAGFAASGTSVRTMSKGKVWIATGGTVSNLYSSANYGKSWSKYSCPIWQGENSTGVFSAAFSSKKYGIVVGGNYLKDKDNTNNIWITRNGGKSWVKPKVPINGYRSAIEYLGKSTWVAVGSSGVDYSIDNGETWNNLSNLNFNAVRKAKNGNLVLLTGPRGVIYELTIQ